MESEPVIFFETKEESNERRLEEALARTPHERFLFFLEMVHEMHLFNVIKENPNRNKNNFVLDEPF